MAQHLVNGLHPRQISGRIDAMAGQYSDDRIAVFLRQACPPAVASPGFKEKLYQRLNDEATASLTTAPKSFWRQSLARVPPAAAMAVAIEAMLDAQIRSRLDEHEDIRTLSKRLKRVVEQNSDEPLAAVALLRELEYLTKQLADVLRKIHRPTVESIAEEVIKRVETATRADALAVARAIVSETGKMCLDDWDVLRGYMDRELERCLTHLLSCEFKNLRLHMDGQDFVDRCILLLKEDSLISSTSAV
jgi:hypothetical protein